ncbi:MAG: hypothetical protein A4E56_03050 [Pelotomaculum sp. PtaU1.Bin065]|nr:MAG: hypothetical protein A4E56_03050 [Pelotomaculum sp. PtaU1.Bin065]
MGNSLIRPDPGKFFAGQKMDELLNFYGVVKDNDAATVEGAAVIVFASSVDGTERLLGSTFTDREGGYLISIPVLPDYHELLGFKVRAGKTYILSEGVDSPGNSSEYPDRERMPEQAQILNQEHMTGQEKSLNVSLSQVDYNSLPVVVVPTVQTDAATNVGTDSATLNGSITDTSGENCDQRKFQIRALGSENWSDAGIETGSFAPGVFSFTITGLTPGGTYELKAMAHNPAGWGEGNLTTVTAATFPEELAKLTYDSLGGSQSTLKEESLPEKTSYDDYRSTYWRWLRR